MLTAGVAAVPACKILLVNQRDDERAHGYYAVGLFDILGQKRKLSPAIEFPPRNDDEVQQLAVKTVEAARGVDLFRQLFQLHFDTFARGEAAERHVLGLPTAVRAEATADLASRIVSSRFSDTYVAAVPLSRSSIVSAMVDVYRSLLTAAVVWLLSLASRNPVRGGVEIGFAVEMGPGAEVYGEGLVRAYGLESKVAQWPRIVAGERLVNVLQDTRTGGGTPASQRAANVATECWSLLKEGPDQTVFLDALGAKMAGLVRRSFPDAFPTAHNEVRSQLRRHREAGDRKLISRYETLLTYFDSQEPTWRQQL